MKPIRRRMRAGIKWTGAVLTVLLLVVWVGSGWYVWGISNRTTNIVSIGWGIVEIGWAPGRPYLQQLFEGGSLFGRNLNHWFAWWFGYYSFERPVVCKNLFVPIWPIMLLTGVPTALMWRTDLRRRKRERANLCPACGYNLTGLPSGGDRKCPECGTARKSERITS